VPLPLREHRTTSLPQEHAYAAGFDADDRISRLGVLAGMIAVAVLSAMRRAREVVI
jgi:hypothetical protein